MRKADVKKKGPDDKTQDQLKKYVKPGLNLDDVVRLKECFDIFDYEKIGEISLEEIRNSITNLGMEEQAKKIVILMNLGDKKAVTFEGFLSMFGFTEDIRSEPNLKLMFNQFDIDKKGFITFDNFKEVCESLGEQYSDSQIRQMVEQADRDRDGKISFQDFTRIVSKKYGN